MKTSEVIKLINKRKIICNESISLSRAINILRDEEPNFNKEDIKIAMHTIHHIVEKKNNELTKIDNMLED